MSIERKAYKVEEILSISILTEKTIIDLKKRSGKLAPVVSPFGGMTGEGYGSVCCLSDLSLAELVKLRDYINLKIDYHGVLK